MHYLRQCDTTNGCGKTYPGDLSECPNCKSPGWASSPAPVNPHDYGWDIETFPNVFTARFIHVATDTRWSFEISDRVNQINEFIAFIKQLSNCDARGVGYNNLGFDYPVVHFICCNPWVTHVEIYDKAMQIINSNDRFSHLIWESDHIFKQIDLFKIWHYDNLSKSTSLKALEIAMRMPNVSDLPFPVGKVLNDAEKDVLHSYNDDDVVATVYKYVRSIGAIELREGLSEKFGRNFVNMSDVKMGETILITEIERAGVSCYTRGPDGRKHKKQTIRPSINLGDLILPYINFERPDFKYVRDFIAAQTITETKGQFKGMDLPTIGGITYEIAKGGLHASVNNKVFTTNETHQIVDVDVASFYPNMAIANNFFPSHLGTEFCDAYLSVYETRKTYDKGTKENEAFKLALNGAYGGSNNDYSPFLDPAYTMSITINGQLLICMLVEQLVKVPGLQMIQANTDGVTFYCPHEHVEHTRALQRWWEGLTKLTLEEALYSNMWVRDVNSYMARKSDGGKLKRIGAYAHERADENPGTREIQYHKNPSSLVVPKAAEAALAHGKDISEFIRSHRDPFDFMIRGKVPRSSKLIMRWPEYDNAEIQLPNTMRYFISRSGGQLVKVSPPTKKAGTWKRKSKITDKFYHTVMIELENDNNGEHMHFDTDGTPWDERIHTKNKSKHGTREDGLSVGWRATDCSKVTNFDWNDLNYDYYIAEAEKLVKPLLS